MGQPAESAAEPVAWKRFSYPFLHQAGRYLRWQAKGGVIGTVWRKRAQAQTPTEPLTWKRLKPWVIGGAIVAAVAITIAFPIVLSAVVLGLFGYAIVNRRYLKYAQRRRRTEKFKARYEREKRR